MTEFELVLDRLAQAVAKLALETERREKAESAVADLRNAGPVPSSRDVVEMMSAMAQGRKIEAIKYCRALTNYGLKEAKDMVEAAQSPQ